MDKIKAFIKKYKTYLAFSLCFIFAIIAGYMIQSEEIKKENSAVVEETRAFITKSNDEPSDKVYKTEVIEVMPDERIVKEDIIPEAFPDSEYEKEPLVTKEALEKQKSVTAAASATFSPSMPLSGKITKPYSVSPLYSATMEDWRSHEAIDISADVGSEVMAMEKGIVKSVGKDALLGYYIRIGHEGGFETLYANLHGEITVIENQEIPKGHVIGYVGESSITESGDEAHLHFEMLKNGKRINPEEYIK